MKMKLNNYFKPTPKKVEKAALFIKGFCGTIATAAFVLDNKNITIIVLVVGALANETAKLFADEKDTNSNNSGI